MIRLARREGWFSADNSWGAPECVCKCESMHNPPWFDPITMMGCGFVCEDCLVSVSQHQLGFCEEVEVWGHGPGEEPSKDGEA